MIRENHGVNVDFSTMKYDDPMIFDLIRTSRSGLVNRNVVNVILGSVYNRDVFEFRDMTLTSLIERVHPDSIDDIATITALFRPDSINDLAATIALFRPGPHQLIGNYVGNRIHANRIRYTRPSLEPILSVTYGMILYQEQIMEILHRLAGYGYSRGDLVRRAMCSREDEVMLRERDRFVNGVTEGGAGVAPGCVANGMPADAAGEIFDQMVKYAEYASCKGHMIACAVSAYRMMWLELHYPAEYAAALTSKLTSLPKSPS
jgi:DNA polymerase-3 subunit alpha